MRLLQNWLMVIPEPSGYDVPVSWADSIPDSVQ